MRAFVAVKPSSDLERACEGLAEAGRGLGMRWVRPGSVHLTLRFWGDLQPDAVPAACEGLRRAAAASAPFLTAARGLGCFPNAERPRVLWMGLDDPELRLLTLRRRIDAALAALGLPTEKRPFRPHLTVARARREAGGGELDTFLDSHKDKMFGHVEVSHLDLMRSDLSAKGAVHTRLHSFPLRGDRPAERPSPGALKEGG